MQEKYLSEEYMDMYKEENVLCAASTYEQKYYFNQRFAALPVGIQEELQIMSVLFTEEVGGIFSLVFDDEGNLTMETEADEEDILYDEIGSALKIKQLQETKKELFESLELFYKTFILHKDITELFSQEDE